MQDSCGYNRFDQCMSNDALKYNYADFTDTYGRIMQFNKNKQEPIHRWYPFVEGYSKEFIQSIIDENKEQKIECCLEPFSGSGTTALELQNLGIKCYSFEINPLMYLIGKVKLETEYTYERANYWFASIKNTRNKLNDTNLDSSVFPTLYQSDKSKKWNYDNEVGLAVKKLKIAIDAINEEIYKDLFTIALAAILLDVSNLYRNGKCLSYKKNWTSIKLTKEDVFTKFDKKVTDELLEDIKNSFKPNVEFSQKNKSFLFNSDSRFAINEKVEDNSIDLVITSPPYLNSRDYTDTYMLELKTLGFTKDNAQIQNLREHTFRSHVQIHWHDNADIKNSLLKSTLKRLDKSAKNFTLWNPSIIDMIRLYFVDMDTLFKELYKKMRKGGKVYFNVSNSAYFNVEIKTLDICASIAEDIGFSVQEIRKARYLKTSPQQKEHVDKLLEGVIVLEKK